MVYLLLAPFIIVGLLIGASFLEEKLIARRVAALPEKKTTNISQCLAQVGTVPSISYYLVGSCEEAKIGQFHLTLPPNMNVSSFSNGTLHVRVDHEDINGTKASLFLHPKSDNSPLKNQCFDLVGIPRISMKNGKEQNRYLPTYWFKRSPQLLALAKQVYQRKPEAVLEWLLKRNGTVNAPFDWMQGAEFRTCKECKQKRRPIAQIWGGAIGCNGEAQFYFAACDCPNDQVSTIVQFT